MYGPSKRHALHLVVRSTWVLLDRMTVRMTTTVSGILANRLATQPAPLSPTSLPAQYHAAALEEALAPRCALESTLEQ